MFTGNHRRTEGGTDLEGERGRKNSSRMKETSTTFASRGRACRTPSRPLRRRPRRFSHPKPCPRGRWPPHCRPRASCRWRTSERRARPRRAWPPQGRPARRSEKGPLPLLPQLLLSPSSPSSSQRRRACRCSRRGTGSSSRALPVRNRERENERERGRERERRRTKKSDPRTWAGTSRLTRKKTI